MALLIISNWNDKEDWRQRCTDALPGLDFRIWPEEAGDVSEIEVALAWKPPAGVLASLPNLKLVQSLGMGVDHIFADPELPAGVPIARIVDKDLIERMSEYTVHAVLHYHRDADYYDARQKERDWRQVPAPHASERSVGILGLGAIGRDVARKLKIFGFRLNGWSRSRRSEEGVNCYHGQDGLEPFLAASEFVVCLLPLTPGTENILDAKAFAAMPAGGGIINVARGGHVVDEDLIAALDAGQLSFAKLDVFRQEPLPEDHPFWTHPKIRLTPHNAGITNPASAAAQIVENYQRAVAGREILNIVDPARGY